MPIIIIQYREDIFYFNGIINSMEYGIISSLNILVHSKIFNARLIK